MIERRIKLIYRGQTILCLNEEVEAELLERHGGETEIEIANYVPAFLPDVAAQCVASFREFSQSRQLTDEEMLPYHHTHSVCVALLKEKNRQLKEMAKIFAEISYVEIEMPPEGGTLHDVYQYMLQHLWDVKCQSLPEFEETIAETESVILRIDEMPAINQDMIRYIAQTNICAAGIKYLSECEKYYELIFETRTISVTHKNCYSIYLPDLDICAAYTADGDFITLLQPDSKDRSSLNSTCFLGYRHTAVYAEPETETVN